MAKDYWEKRYLKDKAASVNRAEDYLAKQQKKLYSLAEQEIQAEIEKLYQRFADSEKISLAEAKQKIRDADFCKIDWEGMLQQEKELRERLKEEDLPEEIQERIEQQHKALDLEMKAYAKRGRVSYLELRSMEIDRILVSLYDEQQANIYDYLTNEFDDGYYRSIYNTQQRIGFGRDFTRPNEDAVNRAILNRYDKRNFSKSLYAHCTNFSKDLKNNLVTGLITGENLDKMARRIHKRMGVAYSAAKTLVRTETAYIYETSTMAGYSACGIEWYEFLATLDFKTSETCQEMDGKRFPVRDAVPGKNYPPMHPNCRSTTVCAFPEEDDKKNRTTRVAKDIDGTVYEVSADLTYKEWRDKNGLMEYRYIGNGDPIDSAKHAVKVSQAIAPMPKKVRRALRDVRIKRDDGKGNAFRPDTDTIYLTGDVSKSYIEHEVGHAIDKKLFDQDRVRKLKKEIVAGFTIDDIKIRTGTLGNGKKEKVYVIDSLKTIDTYQGRIYAENKQECLDAAGNIDVDKMHEFVSVAFQYYCDHPRIMKERFPEMYQLVKESVE